MVKNKKQDDSLINLNILGYITKIRKSPTAVEVEKYINKKFNDFKKQTDSGSTHADRKQMLTLLINITNELLEERKKTQHLKKEILLIVEEMEKKMDLLS